MASNNIARLGVVLAMDTAEFTASVNKAVAENQKLAATIKRQSNAAEAEIIRLKHATDDYGKTLTQVELAQRQINSGAFMQASDRHKQELLAQAAALDLVAKSTKGASAGMSAFQKQSLMYQTTDFFTQIASGQNVMIAAIQQGGQLKDTYGGLVPMFKALQQVITPFRLALAGVAAVAGTAAFAAYKAHEEFARLRDDLILTGNFAGITQDRFHELAQGMSGNLVASIGDAKTVLSQLVATGTFTGATFDSVGSTVLKFAQVSGLSADEAAKKLIPSLNGTAASAKSLNDQYHFLTMGQYLQIEALERQGKKQEAIILTSDLLKESLAGVKREVGFLTEAWELAREKASAAWDAFSNKFKPVSQTEKIEIYKKDMMDAMQNLQAFPGDKTFQADYDFAKKKYEESVLQKADGIAALEKKSADALKVSAEIEARNKAGGYAKDQANIQLLAKIGLDTKLAADKEYASESRIIDLDASRAIATAKADFNKKQIDEVGYYTARNTEVLNAQIAQIEQDRLQKIAKYKFSIMLKEEEEYQKTLSERDEADKKAFDLASARRTLAGSKFKADTDALQYDKDRLAIQEQMMFATDRELKQEMLRLDVAREIKALNEQNLPGDEKSLEMQRIRDKEAMKSLQIDAQDRLDRMKDFTSAVFSNMSSAIDNFVKTGKLNFKDFARSVIQDLIAIQLKAQATALLGMAFKGMGLPGIGGGGGFVNDMGGLELAGSLGFANGGDPPLNQASWVGERGPELFVPKTAGTIIPNNALASMGGGGQTVNYNGPYIASMSAIDTQSGLQFLAKNKTSVWSAYQSANRSIPMSR